jgi:hypothetical protein
MPSKKRKIFEPQFLKLRKSFLDALSVGKVENLSLEFQGRVLYIPQEIEYLIEQTIDGMGFEKGEVVVSFFEDPTDISFTIRPPEPV